MLNIAATGGKNLQETFRADNSKGACEISPVAAPSQDNRLPALLCSSSSSQALPYGGRRLRYRNPENLKPWQVHNLHAADSAARALGMPLNTFITIYWEATLAGGAAMAEAFARGMKRLNAWLAYHGARFAYVYVHENPDDLKPNSHVLLHVPKNLKAAFNAKAGAFFDALDGGVQAEPRNRPGHDDTRLQYMAKGADYITCKRYGGSRKAGGQGTINFKRSGTAECLRAHRISKRKALAA